MVNSKKTLYSGRKAYLTPEGLKETQSELEYLKNIKRKEIAEKLEGARELSSDDDSSAYDAALDEQTLLEKKIAYLEDILNNVEVVSDQLRGDEVAIGSTVRVKMNKEVEEFTIVGKMEANPAKKRISNESPVGKALLGAKIGDEVKVKISDNNYVYKVLKINIF